MRISRLSLASGKREKIEDVAREIRALSPQPPEVGEAVREIVAEVRMGGDAAVVALTRRFDSEAAPSDLRVPQAELGEALARIDEDVRLAIETAIANVRRVSEADAARPTAVDLDQGQRVELRDLPVRRAGAYVPGGRAPYPSTVVMCCVPAAAAGVGEVAVATPPGRDGRASDATLAACALCGVDEVYLMGGAQAIAALGHGTESVERVDVIVGPGNHYVQEAKRQLAGSVGIDGVAGPTELVVVADGEADSVLVALDLAAQAEHGDDSLLALVSASDELLASVAAQLERANAERTTVRDAPVALVQVPSVEVAVAVADAIAPEHLELACADADALAASGPVAGCVFTGRGGGAAFGDYAAGSNHVLPTGGAARFAGPLGTSTFRRRQALVSLPKRATDALAPHVASLARAEGFPVHAESAEARSGSRTSTGDTR
jgi:histidinol dehydrogenase